MSVGLELVDEIFGANRDGLGFTSAGNDEATRGELVARAFDDIVLLAGDKRFVNFDGALFDFAINNDLVAEGIDEKIAINDFGLGNLERFAVPYHSGFLLGDETHFVDSALGADAVDNGNTGVGDSDSDK